MIAQERKGLEPLSMIQYENTRNDLSAKYLIINTLDSLTAAGQVTQALDATISDLDSVKIGTFPADELFDFRAQRPIVNYRDGKLESLVQPELRLSLVTDIEGENFLYLSGQEPDYRWESVSRALLDVINRFKIADVISFSAMPATIPHTRPADMLLRSTQLRENVKYVPGKAVHPGSLSDYFEFYAGKHGVSVTNVRVRVPFYLVQIGEPFLSGALAAVRMTADLGGPKLPVGDLEQFAERALVTYGELIEQNPDLNDLITMLEREYDANPSEQAFATSDTELMQVPSMEEIGRAAEKFLAVHAQSQLADVIEEQPSQQQISSEQSKRSFAGKLFGFDFGVRASRQSQQEQAAKDDSGSREIESEGRQDSASGTAAGENPRNKRRGKHHW
ncbi:PAC2 family protein [Arcanobacterium hippocoleae]|uniref:PAC2 family protein n=1 Tax=Arcanobacterium hippocoleae TaxID=149017 RepID=A0ABU1T0X0_9ACTO|nr:PAC2 family protein [Arcanobacterium hippocoleae]MDR6939014.1 hypothetical protein [Arcanobacterium hippocoleae]